MKRDQNGVTPENGRETDERTGRFLPGNRLWTHRQTANRPRVWTLPEVADLAQALDFEVAFTVQRFLRGLPCCDVEELIARTWLACNSPESLGWPHDLQELRAACRGAMDAVAGVLGESGTGG
jgi:hypothetical protein